MGAPAAVPIAHNDPGIESLMTQECPECGGVMATINSRIVAAKRYRRFECRSCGHRLSLGGDNADQAIDRYSRDPRPTRRFDAATIKAIRESPDGRRVLAKQYGCSETMIRDIVAGRSYRDLLPEGFRSPPCAGDPSCMSCRYWKAEACGMGFPDPAEEGPAFARDCSLYAVEEG
jgi:hypothetical protein